MGYNKANKPKGGYRPKKNNKNKEKSGGVVKNVTNSRKLNRKKKREDKKARRRDYFSKNKVSDIKDVKEELSDVEEKPTKAEIKADREKEMNKKREIAQKKKEDKMKDIRNKQLLKANEEEDRVIKKLEKQLHLKKKKPGTVPKSFELDGLNYLLEVCDGGNSGEIAQQLAEDSGSEFEEDFLIATGKNKTKDSKKKTSESKKVKEDDFPQDGSDKYADSDDSNESQEHSEEELQEELQEEMDVSDEEDFDQDFDESDDDSKLKPAKKNFVSKMSDDDVDDDDFDTNDENSEMDEGDLEDLGSDSGSDKDADNVKKKADDGSWEDIYGRKRDKDGNVITENQAKYIPPSLRKENSDSGSKEDARVRREIKSTLNKLTASNMHWTSSQMEKNYSTYSRNAVNNSFCSLWMESIVKPFTIADRMVVEHAMLVAILHANVGNEVGAYFLQHFAEKFDDLIKNQQEFDKSLENLVLAMCHLYNFKIFESTLLYDILNRLTENLSEKTIECLLIAFRTMGSTLRKEDPLGLKTFIQNTQHSIKSMKSNPNSARADFFLDILLAIKNNNLNKIPNYDPTYLDEMKKNIKGIIRKGNRVVSLNISLKHLLQANEKGKWWIVGSAWEGDLKPEKLNKSNDAEENETSAYLLKLADGQRINTDIRRKLFVIIMSAEDATDAFEKLMSLNLPAWQEREIVNVLLSCCLQEKVFNAYYAVVAQKLCGCNRRYQLGFQFSVWDKVKELDSFELFQITNLARFLSHLFVQGSLSISVLKVIEFADLNKRSMRLMRQILVGVLLCKNASACYELFQRIVPTSKLRMFRESLRLFISQFLLKNLSSSHRKALSEEEMATLKERCTQVDKILHADGKVQF